MSCSSRGLGHHPFTVSTGVRIPYRTPSSFRMPTAIILPYKPWVVGSNPAPSQALNAAWVAQLVEQRKVHPVLQISLWPNW